MLVLQSIFFLYVFACNKGISIWIVFLLAHVGSTLAIGSGSPTLTPTTVLNETDKKYMYYYIFSGGVAVVFIVLVVTMVICACALVCRKTRKKMKIETMEAMEEDPNDYEVTTVIRDRENSLQTAKESLTGESAAKTKSQDDVVVESPSVTNEPEYGVSDDGYDQVRNDSQSLKKTTSLKPVSSNAQHEEELTYDYVFTEEDEETTHTEVNPRALQLHGLLHPPPEENENNYENFPVAKQPFRQHQQPDGPHSATTFSHSNQSSLSSVGSCQSTKELIKSQPHITLVKGNGNHNDYHQGHQKWPSGRLSSSFDSTTLVSLDLTIHLLNPTHNGIVGFQITIRSTMHTKLGILVYHLIRHQQVSITMKMYIKMSVYVYLNSKSLGNH